MSNSSSKINIPKNKDIEGEIYCIKPMIFKGSLFNPSAYNKSGVAVAIPLSIIKIQ